MPYSKVKVYFDGSNFIGIPPTTNPVKERHKPAEELIEVKSKQDVKIVDSPPTMHDLTDNADTPADIAELTDGNNNCPMDMRELTVKEGDTVHMTKKDYFEMLYKANSDSTKKERRENTIEGMRGYSDTYEQTANFVDTNIERKNRNLMCRRVRLSRKVNLQEVGDGFNYFCTFTYDDKKHTEDSFKKGLLSTLRHFSSRKGCRYIGVWERGEETKRLHFHAMFYIPEGTMSGEIIEVEDYDTRYKRMRKTHQNTFFNNKFGRSDFDEIETSRDTNYALSYITKYIEKTGKKIVYSRGLPQYFLSDIMDEDVICPYDEETSNKIILNDKFTCWDEGVKIGEVSPETIAQMPKSN